MREEGAFIISLDFELHWGGFEKWSLLDGDPGNYKSYFLSTREVIPCILDLFAKYEIHATWATVGMLLHESKEQLLENSPKQKPTYKEEKLSAYNYLSNNWVGFNEIEDPFHYAPSLVKKILTIPGQELGSHTYSHFYCNEEGQTVQQFREDLQAAKRVASNYNAHIQSLVFPRNQFNGEYLKVCAEEGITSVRSNPTDWFWHIDSTQEESKWKRLNRGVDAYFQIGKKNTYRLNEIEKNKYLPICLPASRLLRPYNPSEFFLNSLKISRIKNEIESAAKNCEVYHLWWHPHNFSKFPDQNLKGLKEILEHFARCRDTYKMESLNMAEVASQFN